MSTTTRKPAAVRREEIARAVLRIIGERGLTSLTTSNLAAEVGLTTGALYRHFASREEILREAKDMRAHLIVMGTHSDKTLQQNIMGSTMTRVLRQAPCPVLTIRYPVGEEDAD